jgi:hypothetical protein
MNPINLLNISNYNINISEALRYMGAAGNTDSRLSRLTDDMSKELLKTCRPLACYTEFEVKMDGDLLDFGFAKIKSKNLAKNLKNCSRVIIFAATLGAEFERLLNLKQLKSPTEAVVLDAVASSAIEGVCDAVENVIKEKYPYKMKPRFSPGYGDLDISFQKNIAEILKTKQKIGLAVSDFFMLMPTKSVTAIIGLE